jgi:tripartite-type tricarboxylate transporter receptor subunit TctC
VIAGHTQIMFSAVASAASQIKAGQLRPLAVTGKTRSAILPEVPTTTEAGYPDIEGDGWVGVLVPAGTPKEIITSLHREMVRIIALPDMKERLPTLGFEPIGNTPEEFEAQIKAEIEKWARIVRDANVKTQ